MAFWMGAEPNDSEQYPAETNHDGCPASWYRCEFFQSVDRYRRGEHENPHLIRCEDRLVLDAVIYLERELARAALFR